MIHRGIDLQHRDAVPMPGGHAAAHPCSVQAIALDGILHDITVGPKDEPIEDDDMDPTKPDGSEPPDDAYRESAVARSGSTSADATAPAHGAIATPIAIVRGRTGLPRALSFLLARGSRMSDEPDDPPIRPTSCRSRIGSHLFIHSGALA